MKKRLPQTQADLAALERSMAWHFPRLERELIEGPHSLPDAHLAIAGHLRVLLCDHKYPPILITYARARGIDLIVYGPRAATKSKKTQALFAWRALIASWQPVGDSHPVPIEAYLDTPIGVTSFEGMTDRGAAYTPRDVVTWVANTEGVTHFTFDENKAPAHRSLKKSGMQRGAVTIEEFELRRILQQLGVWTMYAMDHVLPPEPLAKSHQPG